MQTTLTVKTATSTYLAAFSVLKAHVRLRNNGIKL